MQSFVKFSSRVSPSHFLRTRKIQFTQKRFSVVTRFAPSPTGFMHLGALRTALFCYLFSRKNNGKFILRIEDTDKTREVPGSIDQIKETLKWAGLHYDEMYVQSERLHLYKHYADLLLQKGHAYKCFCTKERLESLRLDGSKAGHGSKYDRYCLSLSKDEIASLEEKQTPYTIRMKIPDDPPYTILNDEVFGKVIFKHDKIDDQVLIKSDGYPTYHLANVVDDHTMGVTHVIRGNEWLPSTGKHILLYRMLGWKEPTFAHLPLLINADGTKLSKRQGHASVDWYREKGFEPEAVLNFVALLGWNPGTKDEIFNLKELIEKFSLDRVNKANSMVSMQRLEWINCQHLRRMVDDDIEKVIEMLEPHLKKAFPNLEISHDYLKKVLRTAKKRMDTIQDFPSFFHYFFTDVNYNTEKAKLFKQDVEKIKNREEILQRVYDEIEKLSDNEFTCENLDKIINDIKDDKSLNTTYKEVLWILRFYLSGTLVGPGISEMIHTLGKEVTLKRLKQTII